VGAVVEKILALDAETYSFEVIFSLGLLWEEDRTNLLPVATPDEMAKCPETYHCGMCFFAEGGATDTCVPDMRGIPMWTDPRSPRVLEAGTLGPMGRNKCCEELWNPASVDLYAGITFPNAKEIEVLDQEGPTFFSMDERFNKDLADGETIASYGMAYLKRRIRGVFYIPMDFRSFPNDQQFLDIHVTTAATTNVFNLTNISSNPNASGVYVAGGAHMPKDEKKRLGLAAPSGCPAVADGEGAEKSFYEDLSGWSIAREVEVLSFDADQQDCLLFSPCNISYPIGMPAHVIRRMLCTRVKRVITLANARQYVWSHARTPLVRSSGMPATARSLVLF